MLGDGVVEQGFEQRGAFSVGDLPGDDPAAENINDDVEIEVAPFHRSHQFRDVPGPNLIWAFGEEFGLLINGAAQLPPPFADFVMLGEDAIHGADRAQIDALVEQAGVDFGWGQIDEPRLPQQVEDGLALLSGKRPPWRWPRARSRWRSSLQGLTAMTAGARQPERRAGGGDQAAARRQSRHGVHQDPSSLSAGRPSNAATFFCNSMIASARSKRCFSRRLSRRDCASSAAKGFGSAVLARLSLLAGCCGRKACKINIGFQKVFTTGRGL